MDSELAAKVSGRAFEERYARAADPWDFESSRYEQNRYECLLRSLSKARYQVVYEPGCSVGVLTARLSELATRVIATDIAPSAVARARARCRHLSNVEVLCESVATYAPTIPLDLIAFSEIGYYFDSGHLAQIAMTLAERLQPHGEFVAVHWLGTSEDHVLHGNAVHDTLMECLPLTWIKGEVHPLFRIDSWIRT